MEQVTLSAEMVDDALELSAGAGWNQTEADWLALMNDSPDGCFGVVCDGRLVATTTLVCYEKRLAWVGMVLTHLDYRRRGFARLLVERAIELAREREVRTIKLDATDQGRPLYLSLGFRDEQPVERWRRDGLPDEDYRPEAPPITGPGGYLLHRPGMVAHYLGPCVANDCCSARDLLIKALDCIRAPGYFWDLLPENQDAPKLARSLDFTPVRKLSRMVLGKATAEDQSRVYAIAGFEWG